VTDVELENAGGFSPGSRGDTYQYAIVMKKYILLFLVAIIGSPLFAQQLTPRLVASAGQVLPVGQGSLSFSVGEPVIQTLAGGTIILNQGFQQAQLLGDTLGLIIPVVQAQCGNSLDIPVRAINFKSMLTMQGSINWAPAHLKFELISNYGPASLGLSAANFGVTDVASGQLRFSWNDPRMQGVTLPDTTTLFVMRFKAIDSMNRTIPVTITGTPTPLEFYDSQLKKKPYVVRNGAVNQLCAVTISGRLITPLNQGVSLGTVGVTGTETKSTLSDASGRYTLPVRPGNYTLTPSKNNEKNKLNGVSTLDIALIQSHILNNVLLNSPYKVIAADADGSNAVTTADIVYLRRMILGIDTSLPGNRTWAFVDSAQTFANPVMPFPYISSKTYTNLSASVNQTFRAIKLGDVNWDRNPTVGQALNMDTLRLYTEAVEEANGAVIVRVKSREMRDVMGFQFTLKWTPGEMEYLGIGTNPLGVSFGEQSAGEGYLSLSWNDPEARGMTMRSDDLLFELRFAPGRLPGKKQLLAGSWKIVEEIFDRLYAPMYLLIDTAESKKQQPLVESWFRVYPNPAGSYVHVQWTAVQPGEGYVRILDASGRTILEQKVEVKQGLNTQRLALEGRPFRQGTYFIQLDSGGKLTISRLVIQR